MRQLGEPSWNKKPPPVQGRHREKGAVKKVLAMTTAEDAPSATAEMTVTTDVATDTAALLVRLTGRKHIERQKAEESLRELVERRVA